MTQRSMRRTGLIVFAALQFACDNPEPAPDDAVAVWKGGHLLFEEIEQAANKSSTTTCEAARRSGAEGSVEEIADFWTQCYLETAQGLALEQRILQETPDLETTIRGLERYPELERQAFIKQFTQDRRSEVTLEDQEIERYYQDHQDEFLQPASLTLWNIFRRHEPGASNEATIKYLKRVADQFRGGHTFSDLARKHSQSETRLRGGLVGTIRADELPQRLADVATALAPGDVSAPILVSGGAVLLHVTQTNPELTLTLAEARPRIEQTLTLRRIKAAITNRLYEFNLPEESELMDPQDLFEGLDASSDFLVLSVGDWALRADELRQRASLPANVQVIKARPELQQRVFEIYEAIHRQWWLARTLLESKDGALRSEGAQELQTLAQKIWVEERIDALLRAEIERDPAALESFFEDNPSSFQTPLRYNLTEWTVPFGEDPPNQLRELEVLRDAWQGGSPDWPSALERLGGSLKEHGWLEFEELRRRLPNKAVQLLGAVGPRGFLPPYQQDEALHLVWLAQREEPRQLTLDEVLALSPSPLIEAYLDRHGQRLFAELTHERLQATSFSFDEAAVRAMMGWPELSAPSER